MAQEVPYGELDPNIIELVRALNAFEGIETSESCEGHSEPKEFFVSFHVAHNEDGWFALEFLAWAINDCRQGGYRVVLTVASAPPYLNFPGQTLCFAVRGLEDPNWLAGWINEMHREHYVSPRGLTF